MRIKVAWDDDGLTELERKMHELAMGAGKFGLLSATPVLSAPPVLSATAPGFNPSVPAQTPPPSYTAAPTSWPKYTSTPVTPQPAAPPPAPPPTGPVDTAATTPVSITPPSTRTDPKFDYANALAQEPVDPFSSTKPSGPVTPLVTRTTADDWNDYQKYLQQHYQKWGSDGSGADVPYGYEPPLGFQQWLAGQNDPVSGEEPYTPAKYTTGKGTHLTKTDKNFIAPKGWDAKKYLADNLDLLNDPWAKANPLAHYALFGYNEGRGYVPGGYAKANFAQASGIYLAQNPGVKKTGLSAWDHYMTIGKAKGLKWPGDEYKFTDPVGGYSPRLSYGQGVGVQAIKRGYYVIPDTGDTPWGPMPAGTKIDVDKYGWFKRPSGPYADYYINMLTGNILPPGSTPTASSVGEVPPVQGTSNIQKFGAVAIPAAFYIGAAAVGGGAAIGGLGTYGKAAMTGLTTTGLTYADTKGQRIDLGKAVLKGVIAGGASIAGGYIVDKAGGSSILVDTLDKNDLKAIVTGAIAAGGSKLQGNDWDQAIIDGLAAGTLSYAMGKFSGSFTDKNGNTVTFDDNGDPILPSGSGRHPQIKWYGGYTPSGGGLIGEPFSSGLTYGGGTPGQPGISVDGMGFRGLWGDPYLGDTNWADPNWSTADPYRNEPYSSRLLYGSGGSPLASGYTSNLSPYWQNQEPLTNYDPRFTGQRMLPYVGDDLTYAPPDPDPYRDPFGLQGGGQWSGQGFDLGLEPLSSGLTYGKGLLPGYDSNLGDYWTSGGPLQWYPRFSDSIDPSTWDTIKGAFSGLPWGGVLKFLGNLLTAGGAGLGGAGGGTGGGLYGLFGKNGPSGGLLSLDDMPIPEYMKKKLKREAMKEGKTWQEYVADANRGQKGYYGAFLA